MSNNSTSLSQLTNVVQNRNKSLGLNLSAKQAISVPNGLKSEFVIIPSVSAAQFGSYFIFDIRERNVIISDLLINFNLSALGGLTGGTPRLSPATFWINKCEIVINNVCIDTLYPIQEFISQQFFWEDEDRLFNNTLQGSYVSPTQRSLFALTAGQNYYVKLRSFFNECHIPILTDSHNVQIRIYMEQFTNIYTSGSATGTVVPATINFANVILKLMKLPGEIASNRLSAMIKNPEQNIFHNVRYSPYNINAGVSSTTIVLSPFVGNIVGLFFTVRPTTGLTGDNAFAYTAITNFGLLDNTSSNMTGGQAIPSHLALQYLNSFYSRSSYTSETSIGCNQVGTIVNNSANVYCWSFSSNLPESLANGLMLGHRKFQGNEQLQITFTSSLAAAVQVDVFCYCQSILEQGANYVKVMAL